MVQAAIAGQNISDCRGSSNVPYGILEGSLTLLELQSHCGDNPVKFQAVCPRNGTAVLIR